MAHRLDLIAFVHQLGLHLLRRDSVSNRGREPGAVGQGGLRLLIEHWFGYAHWPLHPMVDVALNTCFHYGLQRTVLKVVDAVLELRREVLRSVIESALGKGMRLVCESCGGLDSCMVWEHLEAGWGGW